MSNNDAVARAKADITEFDRKINTIEAEQARLEGQKRSMVIERDRIKAFIDMYQRYATEIQSPAQPAAARNGAGHPASPEPSAPTARPLRQRHRLRRGPKIDRKPQGIPPMPEMITTALREAKAQGRNSLEPKEMTAFI